MKLHGQGALGLAFLTTIASVACATRTPLDVDVDEDEKLGGPPEAPAAFVSFHDGSRLVARSLSFPGTPALFLGVYDREQKQDCSFSIAADGKLRCSAVGAVGVGPEGEEKVASTADRVSVREILTADGGRFPGARGGLWALVDNRWMLPCGLTYAPSGEGFCVPPAAEDYGFFQDASCTTRLGAAGTDSATPPVIVATGGSVFHAIGSRWTGKVYQGGPASCGEMPTPPAFAYFTIGAPLDGDSVAPIRLVGRGTGRLALKVLESEGRAIATDHVSLDHAVYVDNDLHTDCRPVRTEHDGIRCYPGPLATLRETFADADCTVPAIPSLGSGTVAIVRNDSPSGQLPVVSELRRVGTRTFNTTFAKQGGACVVQLQKQDAVALDGPEPWDVFARLEERVGNDIVP